jgi:hypothetical protein
MTAHYPGWTTSSGWGELIVTDSQKAKYMHDMQRYAEAAGKSYEYNYVIFMDGCVQEYAGIYLAAHSAGENAISIGVQFVNNVEELGTDAQVYAFQWLRDVWLKKQNMVIPQLYIVTPHRNMPGAATACPGDNSIMPRIQDLSRPFEAKDVPMNEPGFIRLIRITDIDHPPTIKLVGDTYAHYLDGAEYNRFMFYYPGMKVEEMTRAQLLDVTCVGDLPPGCQATDFNMVVRQDFGPNPA